LLTPILIPFHCLPSLIHNEVTVARITEASANKQPSSVLYYRLVDICFE
jgi:hypothetical protein